MHSAPVLRVVDSAGERDTQGLKVAIRRDHASARIFETGLSSQQLWRGPSTGMELAFIRAPTLGRSGVLCMDFTDHADT